ncbi:hypothetical protein CI109_103868 [Kwoniella shandongensis]|uniref:CN hydrolase domain-containing protein n=1 Tax=Kwoniella shandongensis TaxID=1734106 RepID=A0AAJ8LHM3_9TREE
MSQIRIALAQTCPVVAPTGPAKDDDDIFNVLERNLIDARGWVEKASKEKADVVVFPEYFLQGLYLTYPSPHLIAYLSHLAKEHNVSIVGTIIHSVCDDLPPTSPFDHLLSDAPKDVTKWREYVKANPGTNHSPQLLNTAFYIEAGSGKVLDEFVKRNLWHPERDYLTPGQAGHQVFDTKWGRCGFLICWDVSHPSAGQALSDLGADIVFAPTYWIGYDSAPTITKHHANPPKYETEVLSTLSYARAFETETAWIMCNAGGPAKEGYIGGSGVWMPLKGKIGGYDGEEVGLKVVDVDLDVLKVSLTKRKLELTSRMHDGCTRSG